MCGCDDGRNAYVAVVTDGRSGARPAGQDRPSTTYTGSATGSNSLAEKLRDVARTLQNESGVERMLKAIIAVAADTVPGAESASISVLRKRHVNETLAATDHLARAADQAQTDAGEGPYLGSVSERRTVRLLDMSAETRWPEFAARAREVGSGSMLVSGSS